MSGKKKINKNPLEDPRGMNWFKFLIYFALFMTMISMFIRGIGHISGSAMGPDAAAVYASYPALKTVNIVFGIILFAVGLLALFTRQKLAKFKKDGPMYLYVLLILNTVSQPIYNIAVKSALGADFALIFPDPFNTITMPMIVATLSCLVLLWANKKYFDNRADLFSDK